MGNPELLLLDEPSEDLELLVVEALLDNVRALKRHGVTILLGAARPPTGANERCGRSRRRRNRR